jgi:acetyl esterase/lipase
MIHEKIFLPEHGNAKPYMTTYILDNYEEFSTGRKRPVIVICPGGGYEMLSYREAEAVAVRMNALGFHACIVWYTLRPMCFPDALADLAQAVKYIRHHAHEWNIREDRVIAAGFSAGGHLAASLGVYWNTGLLQSRIGCTPEEIRPDGLMLGYPVITAQTGLTHESSILNVLGNTETYTRDDVSLEKHVTADVPPVFLWHTYEDGCVPCENSLRFTEACRKAGVPVELHLFRRGGHGLSLASAETSWADGSGVQKACSVWPELFAEWMAEF